jgi:ABC-type polysaccharide/polyol phosphate transport system ATPase subunit/alpha-L-arabinofuranosidase
MMNETAIKLQGMSKKYRVYFEKPALVRSLFPFLFSGKGHHEFWALRDIDLEIKKGECIGVVGPNGAGKSTVLSILSGITEPTLGSVQIDGKISALLSLGAGFQPELTGRENIYLNAAILGMRRAEVDAIFDQIVEYAGIGEFMEAKLSTYSSGMNMRLGFAIAVNVPFDILLIDELLAVGDMAFQQKCFKTMRDFTEDEDRTIIFVSHDIGRIEEMCSRAVWLENGRVEEMDSAEVVARKYRQRYRHKFEAFDLRIKKKPREYTAEISVDAGDVLRQIPRELFGANVDWTNEGSLIWDQGKNDLQQHVVRTLAPYRFSVLRYPGGQSPDHFHWQEATGEKRKPQIDGHNHLTQYPYFGPDEFVRFCRAINATPLLTLNIGSGTVEEALGWARYMKEKGVDVPYWELGHELYYDDYHNLGRDFPMSPEDYAKKACAIARGLKEAAPGAKVMVTGCKDTGVFTRYRSPHWNRVVLDSCGPYMDYLSIHNATVPIMNITPDYTFPELEDTAKALLAAPLYVEESMNRVAAEIAESGAAKSAKIAVTDYSVMFTDIPAVVHGAHQVEGRPEASIEWERNTYHISGLLEAMLLNLFIRREDVSLACRFSLLSQIYSSIYRYAEGRWIATSQAFVHELYNRLAGHQLVRSRVTAEGYDSPAIGVIPAQAGVPYLDAVAVKTEDGSKLIIAVINRNLESDIKTTVNLKGFSPAEVTIKTVSAPQFYSRNTAQNPSNIFMHERTYPVVNFAESSSSGLRFNIPRHSLTFMVFSSKEWL